MNRAKHVVKASTGPTPFVEVEYRMVCILLVLHYIYNPMIIHLQFLNEILCNSDECRYR